MEKRFTTIKLPNKISELSALYNEAQEGKLAMECTPYNNKELSEACGEEGRFRLEFGKVQLYSIFQSVRSNILKWTLTLMKNKGVEVMTKDAEKLLKYIVNESKKQNSTEVSIEINDITDIPNVRIAKNKLLDELEVAGVISGYKENTLGELYAYLTTDGQEYFEEKEQEDTMSNSGMIINVNGGQLNFARDNATIHATQNNGVNGNELDDIIRGIMENLSGLEKEDADEISDIVEIAKDELTKPEPKLSRLRNCLTLITPMFTIANGIPTLASNLQKLQEFIMQYMK